MAHDTPKPDVGHKLTQGDIQEIRRCLHLIERSRKRIAAKAGPEVAAELRTITRGIYHLIGRLPTGD